MPHAPGIAFFSFIRNLTATGFYSSKEGMAYVGYVGNRANTWDGVPAEVLAKHGFTYDDKITYVTAEDRESLAEWDEEGNLVG